MPQKAVNDEWLKAKTAVEPEFWTVKDAARYLKLSPSTVYAWIAGPGYKHTRNCRLNGNKRPPFKRFGPFAIRIPIKEFKDWAANFKGD